MTTHAIYIDARRPEAQFSLRVMGYSASSIEISVLNGAALADLTGQGIALWYGPVPATGQPQLGHTVTGTVTASGCAVVDLALADTGYEGRLVAQVVSIVDGVSSVLGSGEIWMLANPARDTLPMTFDAPPWATADDIDAAISARVAGVEDLPDEPTYDQIIALLRAVLSALKGAAKIALAMLALGAGAQTSRLGSLRAGDIVVTNEQDALAYPLATNALALAEGALQPPATNGLPVAVAHAESAHGVTLIDGFAGGINATAEVGGALGLSAFTIDGGAIGATATSSMGGAVGYGTVTSDGFAGGNMAKAAVNADGSGAGIDAIQLGTGWNPDAKTLQIYGHKLMNADGSIPSERMAATLSAYATTGAVAAVQAEVVDPWIDWSATITPINGTATVTRATGADPVLVLTDDVVISVPTDNWPTTGVSRVSLSLWAGAHSVTLLTNTVEYSSTPAISTNDWTTILFRRAGDQAKWKGVGL